MHRSHVMKIGTHAATHPSGWQRHGMLLLSSHRNRDVIPSQGLVVLLSCTKLLRDQRFLLTRSPPCTMVLIAK